MFGRMLRSVGAVIVAWFVVTHLEDVARYFRMRDMSRSESACGPRSSSAER